MILILNVSCSNENNISILVEAEVCIKSRTNDNEVLQME